MNRILTLLIICFSCSIPLEGKLSFKKIEKIIQLNNYSPDSIIIDDILFWTDEDGSAEKKEIINAKFSPKTDLTYVRSMLPGMPEKKLWIKISFKNYFKGTKRLILHSGNIEYAGLLQVAPNGKDTLDILGGYLRHKLQYPHLEFDVQRSTSVQTIYLCVENFFIPPSKIIFHLGTKEAIENERKKFYEDYIWWFTFQVSFASVGLFLSITMFIKWITKLSRVEHGYYALYQLMAIIIFSSIALEVFYRSFSAPMGHTFTLLLLRVLFIVFSFAYVHFFVHFLEVATNTSVKVRLVRITIIQLVVIILDTYFLFIQDDSAIDKLKIFAFFGAVLTIFSSELVIHINNNRKQMLTSKEGKCLNVTAFFTNVFGIMVAVCEVVNENSVLGPVGLMTLQICMMIESIVFVWAVSMKTDRLNEEKVQFLKSIGDDIHDLISHPIAEVNKNLEQIKLMIIKGKYDEISSRIDDQIKDGFLINLYKSLLIDLHSSEDCTLNFVIGTIQDLSYTIFSKEKRFKAQLVLPEPSNYKLSPENRKHFIFIVLEILTNCFKHSLPDDDSTVDFNMIFTFENYSGNFSLTITDSGKGFDKDSVKKGRGLNSIEKRAKKLNANLVIETSPGKGMKFTLEGKL